MRKKNVLHFMMVFMLFVSTSVFAHPGRTDSNGGHWNRKTGVYHYHNGSKSKSEKTPAPVYATEINVSNVPSEINIGESVCLDAKVIPENAEDNKILWESDNNDIVSVDDSGCMSAVGVGTAVIHAKTERGLSAEYTVTVKEIAAESVEILCIDESTGISYDELRFVPGANISFSAVVLPENTTNPEIRWSVDSSEVAVIDDSGVFTALSDGDVTVCAETVNGIKDTVSVEIYTPVNVVAILLYVLFFVGIATVSAVLIRHRIKKKRN